MLVWFQITGSSESVEWQKRKSWSPVTSRMLIPLLPQRFHWELFQGEFITLASSCLLSGEERVTLFLLPAWTFYFHSSLKCPQKAKCQTEGSVYLCNRLEHIHILCVPRANISFGMKLRQRNRIRQNRPPKTEPPAPRAYMMVPPYLPT